MVYIKFSQVKSKKLKIQILLGFMNNFLLKHLSLIFNKLDSWIDEIEYRVGNIIDPPKAKFKKGDDTDKWCNKITARQAFRYAKYMRKKWNTTRAIVENGDISIYKLKKDRKLLQDFCDGIIKVSDYHEDLYKRMY